MKTRKLERRDHLLPQGYLRGFIHPARKKESRPLWVYDVSTRNWSERSTSEVAYSRGFYDCSGVKVPGEAGDRSFKRLEKQFPGVRNKILQEGFESWVKWKDFLLEFANMLRARSELFREQHAEYAESSELLRLTEKLSEEPDIMNPSRVSQTWSFERVKWNDPTEKERLLKNWAITDMREEVKRGGQWLKNLNWACRYTTDPEDPVITSSNCVIVDGSAPDLDSALVQNDTLCFFPVCWQICMVGSPRKLLIETDRFVPADLARLRSIQAKSTDSILISPSRLSASG